MKVIWKIIAATMVAACCLGAHAGTQTGTITMLDVRASDGLIIVYMSGTAANRASCASVQPYWMIKDENSTSGKQQLAQLMLAYSTGRPVAIYGMGTCVRWSDGEDIDRVSLR